MKRQLSFVALLGGFWLTLSGHFTGLLLFLGAASVALVAWLGTRMQIVDRDGHPVDEIPRVPGYLLWLWKEIVLSSVRVVGIILSNDSKPKVGRVKIGSMTARGQAQLANSITLTPGTLTLRVLGDEIEVHSIHRDILAELQQSDFVERVRRFDAPHA